MKCFDVVQRVLDATYAEIPGDDATRDAAVSKALRNMSDQYRNHLLKSGGPDFSDPVTRFAYVFLYVPAHSHWLYELLTWSKEAKAVFESPRVRMTCIGGGPGSDLVGVLKYMSENEKSPSLFCEIVDGCLQWKRTWSDLAYTLEWQSPLYTDYIIHDVANKCSWADPCNFEKADVFTLSFFASEIYHLGQNATEYLTFVLEQAKPGALVLFNDNNISEDKAEFRSWLDGIACVTGFHKLIGDEGDRRIRDWGERSEALETYQAKFNKFQPRLTGNVAWRVFRKC